VRKRAVKVRPLKLIIALADEDEHEPDAGDETKRCLLAVPGFRLPHLEPFTAHGEEAEEPQRKTAHETGNRDAFCRVVICREGAARLPKAERAGNARSPVINSPAMMKAYAISLRVVLVIERQVSVVFGRRVSIAMTCSTKA
jgi:hypothetical protein